MKDIGYYTRDSFLKRGDDVVFYGFFTRKGGISTGVYEGLNCGLGSNDNEGSVRANRERVAVEAGVASDRLLPLYQVHGSKVITVDKPWSVKDRPEADAMVTNHAGVALSILTADCAPVLFYCPDKEGKSVIGAAHAGWGGALMGVLDNTVEAMVALGADEGNIRACVGPCIGRASYEVGVELMERFLKNNDESERFFCDSHKDNHFNFDLSGYCAWRLARSGVKNVSLMDMDTYSNEDDFYSFRRSTHRKESDYGRQISVISIKNY